jgi:uncharacterized protein (DUF427 family)
MPKAIWNGAVIADSDDTIVVEGNHYFPNDSVDHSYLVASDKHSVCPWKGNASYYTIEVDGKRNEDAAWYYPEPSPAARKTKGHVAFWRGVKIVDERRDEAGGWHRGLLASLRGR